MIFHVLTLEGELFFFRGCDDTQGIEANFRRWNSF